MSNKTMKFVALGVGAAALLVGGIIWYEKTAAATTGGSRLNPGGPKTIQVNAATATVNNILGTPVHANVGDTISVQLGPPPLQLGGGYVDQSSPAGAFTLTPGGGWVMNYVVNAAGTIGIGYKAANAPAGSAAGQIVAFQVLVP
jgi:hypothetical protein